MKKLDFNKSLKTECGFKAEIMFWENEKDYQIHAKITDFCGNKRNHTYTKDGFYLKNRRKHFLNLTNAEGKLYES